MIETKEVIKFFDRLAPGWDADMVRNDAIIGTILDNAGVTEGKVVLDVACGTGVLIPDYLKRRVASGDRQGEVSAAGGHDPLRRCGEHLLRKTV